MTKLISDFSVIPALRVRVKRLDLNAVIPKYAKPGDAGLDLTATGIAFEHDKQGNTLLVYGTGLAFEIPDGHVGLLFPRSSISNTSLTLTNSVGVIDSKYRGEVKFKFSIRDTSDPSKAIYKIGDRIGQLIIIPYPAVELIEAEELSSTERGTGAYGSSGK